MTDVKDWTAVAADNDDASPNGFPEGMAPSGVNDSAREVMAATKRMRDDVSGVNTSGGSSNVYTLAASAAVTAYAQGDLYTFKANHTNTTASTLNVDGLGAKNIFANNTGIALIGGEIISGGMYTVAYDGTQFQLLNPSTPQSVVHVTSGSVAAVSSIQFTDLSAAYSSYLLILNDLLPVTDNDVLLSRISVDNGANYIFAAGSYTHAKIGYATTGSVTGIASNSDTEMEIAQGCGNNDAAGEEIKARIWIHNPMIAGDQTAMQWEVARLNEATNMQVDYGAGRYVFSQATNAFVIAFSGGNIATCEYSLYGYRALT